MQWRTILQRLRAVPLLDKLIAAFLVAAIGGGGFAASKYRADGSSPKAALSFDVGAARQSAPAVANAAEPATALARFILTDQAVASLSRQDGVAPSAGQSDIARFRSRLQITQPSADTLWVMYRDADRNKAATATNAVARMLAAWTPAPAASPLAPAARAVPAAAHPKAQENRRQSSYSSSASLGKLEALLSATVKQLAVLSAQPQQPVAARKANSDAQPPNPATDQRQLLEGQLSAALKKLDDLRVRYTDEYPDVENTKDDIAEIRRELAALPAPKKSNEAKEAVPPRPSDARAEAISELLREEAQLKAAIAAEKQFQAEIEKNPARSPQGPTVASHAPTPLRQSSPASAPAAPVAVKLAQSPFKLVQLANSSAGGSTWPMTLAGLICGLLYLGGAVWVHRPPEMVANRAPASTRATVASMTPNKLTVMEAVLGTSAPRGMAEGIPATHEEEAPAARHEARHEVPVMASIDTALASPAVDVADAADSWGEEVRRTLSMTSHGRLFEGVAVRHEAIVRTGQREVSSDPSRSHEQTRGGFNHLLEVVRDDMKGDPNSAGEAPATLAIANLNKTFTEMELGIAGAPEHFKAQLHEIIVQLLSDQGARVPK